ncbi:MAG: SDR family oxidoreductase [Chitinophagaceae bacterium]|nr:SDR family oxidoreductase [Chitinophagaceae bacterium]
MREKVLFTGGSGLLALNWALHIADRYDVVLGLHERRISVPATPTVPLNLESEEVLYTQLLEIRPQLLIHCAGLANVELCQSDPGLAHHVNVTLSANAARACMRAGVRMVYIATDHLFDGSKPLVNEEEPVSPVNLYGETKYLGEKAVLEISNYFISVRTNFYGWGTGYRRSFSDIILQTLRNNERVNLFEDFFYTPILIAPLADAVMRLAAMDQKGVFNVVGNERISKYEFGIRLAKRFGLNTNLIHKSLFSVRTDLVKRPADLSLSSAKITELLSGTPGDIGQNIEQLFQQEQHGFARMIGKL